jgi:ADP-ribose pyrophosphatase
MPAKTMKLISSEEKYRCSLFWVTEDHAKDPEGFEIRRSVVRHAGSAVMMVMDGRRRVLLVKQYRLPAQKFLWELPAGRLDPGETPLQAARRELREETGYSARKWTKLASYFASPGFLAEKMNLYLAEDLKEGQATPMEDERIETRWHTLKQIEDGIRTGAIEDGKTIAALAAYRVLRGRRR